MQAGLSPLNQWAQSSPSLLALITPERDYTWRELSTKVEQVAATLKDQGVGSSDVLTCVGKNSPELVFTYLACLELGAICALTMPQSEQQLNQTLSTLYRSEQRPNVWFSQPEQTLAQWQNIDVTAADSSGVDSLFKRPFEPISLASIVFTSGSTGAPKAVVHNSQQHFASASGLLERFQFSQADSWLLSLPMYHVSGLAIVYRWLYAGATLKVGEGTLFEDIQNVSHASLVSTQLKRLLESGINHSLTHVLLGGSHVPLELSQQAAQQGIETWLGYGMTEAASTVTAKKIDKIYSTGVTLPKRKLKLEGQRIYIGGETLASGYYHQGDIIPIIKAHWFDTKDLGEWVDNELRIIGRADNQFISGGENIHCEEIEAVLNQMNDITQAIVVPIDDPEFGHRPVAVIQAKFLPTQNEMAHFLQGKLLKFKWPIAYYLMPESLLDSGIKVSRKSVKQWLDTQLN